MMNEDKMTVHPEGIRVSFRLELSHEYTSGYQCVENDTFENETMIFPPPPPKKI